MPSGTGGDIPVPRYGRESESDRPDAPQLVLSAKHVHDEFGRGGPLHGLLLLYTQALITQMAQTAVCNRHHTVDQQLCGGVLLGLDRLQSNELLMTQQLIADMLGVSRGGVTEAAGKLQAAGIVNYARGRITVIDRLALEGAVCECYGVVRKEYDRLLPTPAHWKGSLASR